VSHRLQRLAAARLYLVCGDESDDFFEAALRGGVDIVQLRVKEATPEAIEPAARRLRRRCRDHDALFIVNDHPGLAAEVDADGVHLGQEDLPVAEARRIVGPERLVGLSTHSPAQVDAAAGIEADYIGVGPVSETPTKPGRPGVGLELVRYAAERSPLPFFAIGGISSDNIDAVRGAGAQRVAVVRALTESPHPEVAAQQLRARLTAGWEAPVGAT
jgi:thiamine-phosphate pyrophosphorylase